MKMMVCLQKQNIYVASIKPIHMVLMIINILINFMQILIAQENTRRPKVMNILLYTKIGDYHVQTINTIFHWSYN